MTREEFARLVGHALALEDKRARHKALEPLFGYHAAGELARQRPPEVCGRCGLQVPGQWVFGGVCVDCGGA